MKLRPATTYNLLICILALTIQLIQGTICWATNYFYDDLNRLIRVQHEDGTNILYTYDEVGNRLSHVIGPDSAPPNAPSTPSISDGAQNVPYSTDITWTGGDPNGDSVTYTVFFDMNSHPSTQVASGPSASFHVQNLTCGTTYYWRVQSVDRYGAITQGPVWHFTTDRGPSVKNTRSNTTYSNIHDAYSAAQNGDQLLCQGVRITDNFSADRNISITIDGGFDCTFGSNPDKTTLVGAPVISNGTVTWKNFIISN